ncbi:Primase C terminal 1 (PriCT-1) (plasmid) [Desulfosporosinus acidiphilus SJ4]|uniref:Primase C terminal 1 (PriCT-1) n=1 Tax=Desulfosporosinus acidiphilus (strain DSM 22704 / JCM 16185 / SJ4) TaxID=646529 RepID=I4DCS0_DESAJ|nr:primase C-terminal domain-containing protein [Desulfosporosinus acidiphilus]AFM43594.1 Primase C terminal 1 (PriCT-1) [Desulfosporosinus acidiphilus SJ4]
MLHEIFDPVLPFISRYKIEKLHKDTGVLFSADVKSDARLVWTLPDLLESEKTYITSSTFFGRRRQRRYVRHVMAIVCDFDSEPGTTFDDILGRYYTAHLPLPELIIATATPGHYQAWNVFDVPLRIKHELLLAKEYKVHEAMVKALGADLNAIGPERWVRRPSEENIVYYDHYSRTSWDELCTWYDAQRPSRAASAPKKVVFVGTVLATPAGKRIQDAAAERGCRNKWAYGLGLCLYDAGILASDIRNKLHSWNRAIKEPLPLSDIETIFRSVMSGRHHASSRVLESITGLSARIKGWYKWAKPRNRRRDHLFEVKDDIISDLLRYGTVAETQRAWSSRLGVALRSFKLMLAALREEGIVTATVGHGRYASSSYCLSDAFLKSLEESQYQVAVGSEDFSKGLPIVHKAHSSLGGTCPSLGKGGLAGTSSCCDSSLLFPKNMISGSGGVWRKPNDDSTDGSFRGS